MATFAFGMNLSFDGYVDHDRFAPDPVLYRHWTDQVRDSPGCLYGRGIYELMRYWEDDKPEWDADARAFAAAWRAQPKWVVSRTLSAVGPNATLVSSDIAETIRRLKTELQGEIEVSGPVLAGSLGAMGLIDTYRLYYHPVVLGHGRPFFTQSLPRLRLVTQDRIGPEVIRLTYVPA